MRSLSQTRDMDASHTVSLGRDSLLDSKEGKLREMGYRLANQERPSSLE